MTYELFQQGPAVYVPVLLLSLVITVVAYGAFPLIFAKVRKSPITKKKYRRLCYGINIAVMFLFIAINGGASNGAPYFLWTWAFSSWGTRILEGKGLLDDGTYIPNAPASAPKQSNPVVVTDKVCFCRKCGEKLIDESQFCRKCGTGIKVVSNSEPKVSKPINKETPKTQQTNFCPTSPKSKKAPIIIGIVSAIAVCLIIVLVVVLIGGNNKQSSQNEQPAQSEQTIQSEQTTYNVGVRTITFSDSATAKSVLASWEGGAKTEQSMIAIMDEHGASQGGGQLYIITPGDFVEEIDEWCFSKNRKQGDYAIIENDYGYSLCYFSGRNMEESASQKSDDTLIVAIEADFAPYSWSENGEYYGLHVDIAQEMAKRTDKTVSFVAVDFTELVAGVDSGLYDMAFGLEKTSERAEIVSFTGEYYDGMCAIYHTEGEEPTFSEWTVYTKILQDIVDDGTMKTLLAKYNLS